MARRVQGTFEVPCYLAPELRRRRAGRHASSLDADGLPTQNGTYTANFDCMIPRAAVDVDASPARPSLYGHGLLGSAGEATSAPQKTLGNTHGFVFCAHRRDRALERRLPNAITVLQDLGKFPQLGDRLQQGMLNELFLGRLMIHPQGFASDAAFHADGTAGRRTDRR